MFTFIGSKNKTQCVYTPDTPSLAHKSDVYYFFGKRVTMDPHETDPKQKQDCDFHWEAMILNPVECPEKSIR